MRQQSLHILMYGLYSLVRGSFQSLSFAISKRPYAGLAVLLVVALVYWLWFGMTRAISQDEAISILAARGILEHGYQRLPSGYSYHRGYVQHYLVAGSIGVFGLNDFAIMLPSLLMALGSLWLVYRLARDVTGRPWVGVATAALLFLGVQFQTIYATAPRFYMALQFFTLLATYSAWRGYVQGDVKFKTLTFLAVLAAILSHREGAALAIAIPLSVAIVCRMTMQTMPSRPSLPTLGGILLVAAALAYMLVYRLPGAQPLITAYVVRTPGLATLNPDVIGWAQGLLEPKRALLYAASLTPVAVFAAVSVIRWRWRDTPIGLVYLLSIGTICVLMLMMATARVDARLWFFIVPVYGLLIWTGVALVVETLGPRARKWLGRCTARWRTVLLIVAAAVFTTLSVGFLALAQEYPELLVKRLGPRCQTASCDRSIKEDYAKLRRWLEPGDMIISSNPFITHYYIGRVDGYLREKVIIREVGTTGGQKTEEFESLRDEYIGIPLIDIKDLPTLLLEDRRVLIIADFSVTRRSSEETRAFLENEFRRLYSGRFLTVYVNRIKRPPVTLRTFSAYTSDLAMPSRALSAYNGGL